MNNESDCDVYGHCHEWAYSNWKDGDDFFVVTEYDENIDGYTLVHCGLYRDGKYIDARGSFDTLDDVLDVFDLGVDVDDEILTKNEFEEFCNDYGLSLPLNEHTRITLTIKQIRQLIRETDSVTNGTVDTSSATGTDATGFKGFVQNHKDTFKSAAHLAAGYLGVPTQAVDAVGNKFFGTSNNNNQVGGQTTQQANNQNANQQSQVSQQPQTNQQPQTTGPANVTVPQQGGAQQNATQQQTLPQSPGTTPNTGSPSTSPINEHTKVTLTIGQIKRLICEFAGPSW